MGGDQDRLSAADAISTLGWWLDAGVDVAVQDQPRNWLAEGKSPARLPARAPANTTPAAVEPPPEAVAPPGELPLFRDWLASSPSSPLADRGGRPILPTGPSEPDIMLMAEMPTLEDASAGQPIGGSAWALMERMLLAIQIQPERAYSASLSCFHSPGGRIDEDQLAACADVARHQLRLVKPKLLLLLGDAPARALTGKRLAQARGHVHKVEGVRTVVTFHPRHLLQHPSEKALAWRDLLLLTEEDA